MRYLLDTHTLLWFFDDSPELPASITETIEDNDVHKYISVASLWEFTIKHSMGKIEFEGGIKAFWYMAIANNITVLQVNESHLSVLEHLPLLHRDPFDRLITASAMAEDMTILTADSNIQQYNVRWVWKVR